MSRLALAALVLAASAARAQQCQTLRPEVASVPVSVNAEGDAAAALPWRGATGATRPPNGARVTAVVSDSLGNELPVLARWVDAEEKGDGALSLAIDRSRVPLAGVKTVRVSWRDEGDARSVCARFRLTAPLPEDLRAEWVVNGGEGKPALDLVAQPVDVGQTVQLRLTGRLLWPDAALVLDRRVADRLAPVSLARFAAGARDTALYTLAPPMPFALPGGRYRVSLADAAWGQPIVVPPVAISAQAPVLEPGPRAGTYPAPRGAGTVTVTLRGRNMAEPSVIVTPLEGGGARAAQHADTLAPEDAPAPCAAGDAVQCVRVSFAAAPGASEYDVRVRNFDGRASNPVRVRSVSNVFDLAAVTTTNPESTVAYAGRPTGLTLRVPNDRVLEAGRTLDVLVNDAPAPEQAVARPDGSFYVPGVVFSAPADGDAGAFTATVALQYPDGDRPVGQGRVVVRRAPQPEGTVTLLGTSTQTVRVRGRFLEDARVQSGSSVDVVKQEHDGSQLVLTLRSTLPEARDLLPVYIGRTKLADLPVQVVGRAPLAGEVGFGVGARIAAGGACPSVRNQSLGRIVTVDRDGVLCVDVAPAPGDVDPSLTDTVIVTLIQGGKVLGTPRTITFPARSGTPTPVPLALIGADDGVPVVVQLERPDGQSAQGTARVRVSDRVGAFASLSAVSVQLGRSAARKAIDEKTVTQVLNPQVGFWYNLRSTDKDWRAFGSLLSLRRSYCASDNDVMSGGLGLMYKSVLMVGLGTQLDDKRVPRSCDDAQNTTRAATVSDRVRSFLFIGGGVVLGR